MAASEVEQFFAKRLVPALFDGKKAKRRTKPGHRAALLEAHVAGKLPPDLRALLAIRDAYELSSDLGDWRLDNELGDAPDPAAGNCLEQILKKRPWLGLLEWLTSSISVGTLGNGDVYLASIEPGAKRSPVSVLDHETDNIDGVVADSLVSLAFMHHLAEELDGAERAPKSLVGQTKLLAGKVSPTWHVDELAESTGVKLSLKAKDRPGQRLARAWWLWRLLHEGETQDLRDVAAAFATAHDAPPALDRIVSAPALRADPAEALYWLWYCFFFAKKDALTKTIANTAKSASPLVRDAAALVAELDAGRKHVGKIRDIHALRGRFLALDLDPARAEERAKAKKKAEAEAAKRAAAGKQRAEALIASGGDLVAAAWENLDSPKFLAAAYAHLAERDPALAIDVARANARQAMAARDGWLAVGGGYSDDAMDETIEAFATADARVAPLLMNALDELGTPATLLARLGERRAIPKLLERLGARTEDNQHLIPVIAALGELGVTDAVPKLIGLFKELRIDDFKDAVHRATLWDAVCRALAKLGVATAAKQIDTAMTIGLKHRSRDLWMGAACALADLDVQAVVPRLLVLLDEQPENLIALYVLARMRAPAAARQLRAIRDAAAKRVPVGIYQQLMAEVALARLGDAIDPLLTARAALDVSFHDPYGDPELWIQLFHETALRVIGERAAREEVARLVPPFLDAEFPRVREAARTALIRHGTLPALRYLDRPAVEVLRKRDGKQGASRTLADPHAVLRHNVLLALAASKQLAGFETQMRAEIARLVRFPSYVRDDLSMLGVESNHPVAKDLVRALVDAKTPAAEDAVVALIEDRSRPIAAALIAEVLEYDDDVPDRIADALSRARFPQPVLGDTAEHERWYLGTKICALAFDAEGKRVLVTSNCDTEILDPETGAPLVRWPGYGASTAGFTADGKYVALASDRLVLADAATGELRWMRDAYPIDDDDTVLLALEPGGKRIATADVACVRVWDLDGRELKELQVKGEIASVSWLPGGRLCISVKEAVQIRDAATGKLLASRAYKKDPPTSEPAQTGAPIGVFQPGKLDLLDGELEPIRALACPGMAWFTFSPGGEHVYAVTRKGELLRWPTPTRDAPASKPTRSRVKVKDVSFVAVQPGTRRVFVGDDEGRIKRVAADLSRAE